MANTGRRIPVVSAGSAIPRSGKVKRSEDPHRRAVTEPGECSGKYNPVQASGLGGRHGKWSASQVRSRESACTTGSITAAEPFAMS
jgi:hypothetical protein